ncbi:MAG: penicillin-binding protein 2 [Verrucomicrobia bacterium]|nr:MAG: penicillin-binding protein 2 [Verrucomicrobiota bacterium]
MTLACIGLSLIISGYSIRLIYLQVTKHDEFTALAAQKHSIRQAIHARRGQILDANGEILATDLPTKTVVADGSLIKDPTSLAKTAAPFLEISAAELTQKFSTKRKYVVVKRNLSEERATALSKTLQARSLRGLFFEQDSQRIYPNGEILSQVLGFLDREGRGVQGLEASMEAYLKGENGFRLIQRDRTGREIVIYRGQEHPARNGTNVQLTIDMNLQSMVEGEVSAAYQELKAAHVVAIMMRPQTGEILAMASRPSFNPNNLAAASEPDQLRNHSIMDMVEPGSTFKIVVTSGVLNEKLVRAESSIFCENGRFAYGGAVLRDHGSHYGYLSVHDVLVKSSNIGVAKLAFLLGDQRLFDYIRRFGFGERTGIELPGEISGLVHPPYRWSRLSITRIPMGHEIAVTPLQLTVAMSTIANGGKLMAPHIIKALLDDSGKKLSEVSPNMVRQVISSETAKTIRDALVDVVSRRGSAALAQVNGFNVAGKTGTAQKVNPKGGYYDKKNIVSFVGFLPAENPQFVCLVMVDDAKLPPGRDWGGLVSAPIFSRIAEKAARYMNLTPTARIPPMTASRESVRGENHLVR